MYGAGCHAEAFSAPFGSLEPGFSDSSKIDVSVHAWWPRALLQRCTTEGGTEGQLTEK